MKKKENKKQKKKEKRKRKKNGNKLDICLLLMFTAEHLTHDTGDRGSCEKN